jgi:catechol 2,3-dioxygenase-like lactoylglutathione lyase family enzyme
MTMEMTNCIAIGVSDRDAAEKFYTEVLGFEIGERGDDWTEVLAGPLRLYLCNDDMAYCMAVNVDDPFTVAGQLEAQGCERLFESKGEVFVRDPFGTNWCLSPKT